MSEGITLHTILDHLIAVAPLDEATRISFHHAIAEDRDGDDDAPEGARARIDVQAATPITQVYDDAALRAENEQLRSQIAEQAGKIDRLTELVELALNKRNASENASVATQTPNAPEPAQPTPQPTQTDTNGGNAATVASDTGWRPPVQ